MNPEQFADIKTGFDLHEYRKDNRQPLDNLWESYSALANCNGGVIHLGGLKNPQAMKRVFWNTINNPEKVSVNLLTDEDVKVCEDNGETVLAVHVPRASRKDRPVYINDDLPGGTFRRNNEGVYPCTPSEVRAMLRDRAEETSDRKILEDMDLNDLNQETIHFYRSRHTCLHPNHPWHELTDEAYLECIGAAGRAKIDGKLHPTAAGLLMFGEECRILHAFPDFFLDYLELLDPSILWTDRLRSSSGDWTGNLFDFFFRVSRKLVRDLKVPFQPEGDTPIHMAVRESLLNCLVNADFFLPRGVAIRKDPDQITFENPGCTRTGKDFLLRGGISDPRNSALFRMFNLIGIGSTDSDIFAVWESKGWEPPVVTELYNPDRTVFTLSFRKKPAEKREYPKTGLNRQQILEFLREEGPKTSKEIAAHIGLSTTRIRILLGNLMDAGKVESRGNGCTRRYCLSSGSIPTGRVPPSGS